MIKKIALLSTFILLIMTVNLHANDSFKCGFGEAVGLDGKGFAVFFNYYIILSFFIHCVIKYIYTNISNFYFNYLIF